MLKKFVKSGVEVYLGTYRNRYRDIKTIAKLMDQILAKHHRRKLFFIIVGLLLLVLFLVRYIVLPYCGLACPKSVGDVIADLTDKFMISLVVTVLIGLFVFLVTPEVMQRAKVAELEPREISHFLTLALQTTNKWWYSGNCGKHFRTKTITEMAKRARNGSLTREVTGIILDPKDEKLCESYAHYRRGVKSASKDDVWTVKRVQQELVATIIKTAIIKHQEPLLRVHLSLVNHFSSVRFDMSDQYIILTKEDKNAPAIRLDEGTYFYAWYRDELILTERQSRPVPELHISMSEDSLSLEDVEYCLKLLEISESNFNKDELNQIVNLVKSDKNQYE